MGRAVEVPGRLDEGVVVRAPGRRACGWEEDTGAGGTSEDTVAQDAHVVKMPPSILTECCPSTFTTRFHGGPLVAQRFSATMASKMSLPVTLIERHCYSPRSFSTRLLIPSVVPVEFRRTTRRWPANRPKWSNRPDGISR